MKVHMNIADSKAVLGQLKPGDGFIFPGNGLQDVFLVIDCPPKQPDEFPVVVILLSSCAALEMRDDVQVQRVNLDMQVSEFYRRERRQNGR